MGHTLSCFSKNKRKKGDAEIRPIPEPEKLLKKVRVKEVHVTSAKPSEAFGTPVTVTNHVHSDAEEITLRTQIKLLEPAPSDYILPEPLSPQNNTTGSIKPSIDKSHFSTPLQINEVQLNDNYVLQPVDAVARDLARLPAKPGSWADLHWALIGKRNLQDDELKVRALFTWLCSINLAEAQFISYDELQQASKDNVMYAKEALANKAKKLKPYSPEAVLLDLTIGKSTYLQAFESLCHYSGIPCVTIKGLAKGVDYIVGMPLAGEQISATEKLQHAWNAVYLNGKWCLFDCMWAAQRLAVNANTRLSQIAQASKMDYETDMFYFNVDPRKFIYSHFPFDTQWQLLNPAMTIKQFEEAVLIKPSFFRHELGLLSHKDGVIYAPNKLVVKLAMPRTLVDKLLFTFNLTYEEMDEELESSNLSRFGIHEINHAEAVVTFSFRFPKPGAYKLTLYARRIGEQLFSDVCEYRVESRMLEGTQPFTTVPPFPPTSQSQYGAIEKATELGLVTVPHDLTAQLKCKTGVFEVKFTTKDSTAKLPRLTGRLKSLLHEASMLIDCLLIRTVESTLPTTLNSRSSNLMVPGTAGPNQNMVVLTAYLPSAGEYALEVYGAPASSNENTSYFLVWQFLIDSDVGLKMATPMRKRLATLNLGPQDESWLSLGLRTTSHPDPLIHVPTAGSVGLQKTRSKSELMQRFLLHSDVIHNTDINTLNVDKTGLSALGEKVQVPSVNTVPDPRACDLQIVLERESNPKIYLIGQLVDISCEDEEDRTMYLVQQWDEPEELGMTERITYYIRIPKGDHFYKLYIYGTQLQKTEIPSSIPLVYTYLLEAPARLMSSELPYVGVQYGAFPEKIEQQKRQQQDQEALVRTTAVISTK